MYKCFKMCNLLLILLLTLLSCCHASFTRGWNRNNGKSRATLQNSTDTFDCYLYDTDGIAPPGFVLDPEWTCELEETESLGGTVFDFTGDIEAIMRQNFDIDITKEMQIRMTIPWEAVDGSTIKSDHKGIKINHDASRHKRHLASLSGNQKVLIVRVKDPTGLSPKLWVDDIKDDFFQDSNNLKKRLFACSNGKLNIIPATGPNVKHGVITITVNINVRNMRWKDVGNEVTDELNKISGLQYATRIYLMPDEVDFRGAAAYAQVGGNTIWVKNQYAKFPIVQVHEYGHLLYLRHSGRYGNSYSDNSCHMGNKIPWTDEGALMCFNAAKTWYLEWYKDKHQNVNPLNQPFKGDIVGIDDTVKGKSGSNKMLIKISGDDDEFFLMYNVKKGINQGAIGGADQVVITKQNGSNQESNFEESLGEGQVWKRSNFANTGKNLVVKNCYMTTNASNVDTAKILIYVEGKNNQQCGTKPPSSGNGGNNNGGNNNGGNNNGGNNNGGNNNSGSCQDKMQLNQKWVDTFGFDCQWYSGGNNRCSLYGKSVSANGITANDACCACGGGNQNNTGNTGNGHNGGSPSDCEDDDDWYDAGGPNFNCQWYQANESACQLFGKKFVNGGKTASQACCACK